MTGNPTAFTAVRNRLKKKLTKDDRQAWTRSTVEHICNNDLVKDDIASTDDFINQVILFVSDYSAEWATIKSIKDLKNGQVLKGVKQLLLNMKKKDSKIQDLIDAEKKLRASVTESEGSEVPSQGSDQGNHSTTSKNELKGQDGRRGRRSGG